MNKKEFQEKLEEISKKENISIAYDEYFKMKAKLITFVSSNFPEDKMDKLHTYVKMYNQKSDELLDLYNQEFYYCGLEESNKEPAYIGEENVLKYRNITKEMLLFMIKYAREIVFFENTLNNLDTFFEITVSYKNETIPAEEIVKILQIDDCDESEDAEDYLKDMAYEKNDKRLKTKIDKFFKYYNL